MSNEVVSADYHIQPRHIDPSNDFLGGFGQTEVEVAAAFIVRYCQAQGGWHPLLIHEYVSGRGAVINTFLGVGLPLLKEKGWVTVRSKSIQVTAAFVDACHRAAPAN